MEQSSVPLSSRVEDSDAVVAGLGRPELPTQVEVPRSFEASGVDYGFWQVIPGRLMEERGKVVHGHRVAGKRDDHSVGGGLGFRLLVLAALLGGVGGSFRRLQFRSSGHG